MQEADRISGNSVGRRVEIAGNYVLAKSGVRFRLGLYDKSRPLTIDPILDYSTYLGGSGDEGATGVAVNSYGEAFVTGSTTSTNFPTTNGAFKLLMTATRMYSLQS